MYMTMDNFIQLTVYQTPSPIHPLPPSDLDTLLLTVVCYTVNASIAVFSR